MRIFSVVCLFVFALATAGCGSGATNAAKTYFNVRQAAKVAENSFSQDNVNQLKTNIERTVNNVANDAESQGRMLAKHLNELGETVGQDAKKIGVKSRPSIKIDLRKRLKLRSKKPR